MAGVVCGQIPQRLILLLAAHESPLVALRSLRSLRLIKMAAIKKQIRDRWVTLVTPLVATLGLRATPAWSVDPVQVLQPLPSLLLYATDDIETAVDTRGRTKQFNITNKFCFSNPRESALKDTEDSYVLEITKLVEADIQLGGLANIVNNREVESFVNAIQPPMGIVLVTWRVEYRTRLTQPDVVY